MNQMTVKIDWLRGSFSVDHVPAIVSLMTNYFGQPTEMDRGFWGYKGGIEFDYGAKVLCSLPQPEVGERGLAHATLELSGSSLASINDGIYDLILALRRFEFRCRRIDIAVDDYNKIIAPIELEERYCQSNQFTPFKSCSFIRGKTVGGVSNTTVYFGRRGSQGSGLQLACYDKSAESLGEIDAIRWEARFSDEKAEAIWNSFIGGVDPDGEWCGEIESYEALIRHLGQYVGGAIQFWEDVDCKIPAPFWERIRGCLRRCKGPSRA